MVQLKDDCFAFSGSLMPLDDALAELGRRLVPVAGRQRIPLSGADGAILAERVVSTRSVPPHANSAVDGYAFRFADSETVEGLRIEGRAGAGRPSAADLSPRSAVRILTGAPLPRGADTVVMEEDASVRDGFVFIPAGLPRGANAREAGEDVSEGTEILSPGTRIGPTELGLLAAVGRTSIEVRVPLRTGVFSTGDELVDPGSEPGPGQVHDSNRPMLIALLARLGMAVTDLGILPDRRSELETRLVRAASEQDVLITSGGMSASEEDHVRRFLEERGSLHFWRLAIKPGRPVGFGQIGGTPVIGLPGNPVAALVTFLFLGRPVLAVLSGEDWNVPASYPVRSGFAWKKKPGRREFLRVRLGHEGGRANVLRFPRDGAGILSSAVWAEGLAILDEDVTTLRPGDPLAFVPYRGLIG